ncbi:Cell division transport system permease protein [Candidatus Magnetaquicoccaceae bacterium FCR-1]|uniref:Cell division protein FtsX n=1 Tax=Candidatus Magnetaquiglobus chichijimensis TaxID=3141448 RepID=A0ABQ0C4E6_9PROT
MIRPSPHSGDAGSPPGAPARMPPGGYGLFARIFHARAMKQAWRPFAERSLSHWTTSLVIALALTIHGLFSLLLVNANLALTHWEDDNLVTVFMRRGVEREQLIQVGKLIKGHPGVAEMTIIPPKEAVTRLKTMLGDEGALLDELDENPLPYSLEFRMVRSVPAQTESLAKEIGAMPGVESISHDQQWAERLAALIRAIRFLGNAISLLLLLAVGLIVSNTIKLTIIARRDEMEIMRFLGADDAFIRAPFIYEGLLQGILGACGALLFTSALHLGARGAILEIGQSFGMTVQWAFLPWTQLLLIVLIGAILGLAGAILSVSRFLDV